MGYLGELAGEGLGKIAGSYFSGGNKTAEDIAGKVGRFAGSYLPFAHGGYVCPCEAKKMRKLRKKYRKGGVAGEDMGMAEMAMGGQVAPAQHNPFLGFKPMPYRHGDANYLMYQ